MTREQSTLMKGVAILLMLFLHLFNQPQNVALTEPLIYIGGTPLIEIMARASNPVSFFLFLGGYGLYKVWLRGDEHHVSRLLKLGLHFWFITTVFVAIGHFIVPDKYPGSLIDIISNYTGFHATYNGEMWFLLPYAVVSFISPWVFKLCRRINSWIVVFGTLAVHLGTSFCISRYGVAFLYSNYWLYNPLCVLHMLFYFMLGATVARCNVFEKFDALIFSKGKKLHIGLLASIAVIALFTIACCFKYFYGYAFFLIAALRYCPISQWMRSVLCSLGRYSMNMWMIHSWFCYYLFKQFIYGFKYPVIIFLVLVIVSFLTSVMFEMLIKPIERMLFTKQQLKYRPKI